MAWARTTGRRVGRYSSLVVITGSLWVIWLLMTGVPGGGPSGRAAKRPAVIAVGAIGLAGEVVLVRSLNQVGDPEPPRAEDRRT